MSLINNQTDIYSSPTIEPNFNWQVGFNNFNTISSGVNFRVTVRPLTNLEQFTRIPNPTVLFEETGVVLNGTTSLGLWQFTLAKNLTISGGPIRDYQVVVEAHDQNGNTSAGNLVGSFGDTENGWTAYPNGYDIVAVNNPRPTGIELSNNLPTQDSSTGTFNTISGNTYNSTQYMGANGEIIVQFTSGFFKSGIVGGFIYTSATPFPKKDIFSPTSFYGSRVEQTPFSFNVDNPFIYSPHAAFNVRGAPYCYVSLSFFDELDEVLLENNIDVSTGLYMSNNTIFYNDGAAGSITLGGNATFFTVQTTGYPIISGARWSGLVGSGSMEIARVSTNGNLNASANITTIFYMALTSGGFYTGYAGGLAGGIGGNSTQNITGRTPGGFGTGTMIGVGFDSSNNMVFAPITGISVGQTVVSFQFPFSSGQDVYYNSLIDNWQTTHYSLTGLSHNTSLSGNFTSGVITQIGYSSRSGFMTVSDSVNQFKLTLEQPMFFLTGLTTAGLTGRFLNQYVTSGFVFNSNPIVLNLLGYSFLGNSLPILYRNNVAGFAQSFMSQSTGTFYYVEVNPYNTFFIKPGYLTHNSLYNY